MPNEITGPPKLQKLYESAEKLAKTRAIRYRLKALSTTLARLRRSPAETKT